MKIRRFDDNFETNETRKNELRELLAQPSDKERRPCEGCKQLCGCSRRSSSCTCGCSMDCPDAQRYLSSDPDRHPIEPKVVPLVYAMSTLRLAPPCWSCEGHLTDNEELLRLPQVWFYSSSTLYPQLITEYLHVLAYRRDTSQLWVVTVCPHSESNATVFTIRPEQFDKTAGEAELKQLQDDLDTISHNLRDEVFKIAQNKLNDIYRIEKSQGSCS